MGVPLLVRLQAYSEPWLLIGFSFVYLIITFLSSPFLLLTSPSAFRSKWFDNFWTVVGPKMAATPTQVDHIGDLLSRAHGKVLELGPGSGDQMYHYRAQNIEKLYAAEPNAFLHSKLIQNAAKHDLQGKIAPLEAGGQPGSLLPALKKAGVLSSTVSGLPEQGVFDTVVTIKSLCSLPQTQLTATIAVVQALLKPGGQFLFFEHVDNNTDSITRWYVWLMDWVWPALMGGCRLNGKIDQVVLGMGGWDDRRISTVGDFKGHEVSYTTPRHCTCSHSVLQVFRYVKGTATKA